MKSETLGSVIPREQSIGRITRTGATFLFNPHYGPVALTSQAAKAGAVVGDEVMVKHLGFGDLDKYVIVAHGGGDRTPNGWWADRVRS